MQPNFLGLLSVELENENNDVAIRMAAGVYFKNQLRCALALDYIELGHAIDWIELVMCCCLLLAMLNTCRHFT